MCVCVCACVCVSVEWKEGPKLIIQGDPEGPVSWETPVQ